MKHKHDDKCGHMPMKKKEHKKKHEKKHPKAPKGDAAKKKITKY